MAKKQNILTFFNFFFDIRTIKAQIIRYMCK
jgi:hypothetical protein